VSSGPVTACGSCGSGNLAGLLDMGFQPLAEDPCAGRYPLNLVRCQDCSLIQLSYIVNQRELFKPGHPYATGNSAALRTHYQDLARELTSPLYVDDLVVDIGANDGTLLHCYPPGRGNLRRVAVEPTDQVRKCSPDVHCYQEFFTAATAARIDKAHGQAKVITACNVLAHVPDPHNFLRGVHGLLADDGLFVTENHDVESVLGGNQLDTIYHEHLRYYSVASLSALLDRHGLRVERVIPVPVHGGSFRTYARKKATGFPRRAKAAATALRALLYDITENRREEVWGISASTRATPLVHYAGIAEMIAYIAELPESDKVGTSLPGTQIPVVAEQALIEDQPQYALLLNWHMAGVIVPKLRAMGYKGKFIVPLPEPRVLDA
jgi:hypothetical protein